MFPGRAVVALGTGEASNEHITGDRWPSKLERNAPPGECVDVIRRLHAGEQVSHDGRCGGPGSHLDPPRRAAEADRRGGVARDRRLGGRLGRRAGHGRPGAARLREVVAAYRGAGGTGPPRCRSTCLAADDDQALQIAWDQWRTNIFSPPVCWDLEMAEHFDEIGERRAARGRRGSVLVSADPGQHAAWIQERADPGFDAVYLHHVGLRSNRSSSTCSVRRSSRSSR